MKIGKLDGKVAVVTGASKGIGADIATQFAAEGAAVVVNYASSKEGADRLVDKITKRSGKAVAVQANVANQKDIERLFAETKKAFGPVDILVNNAGVYKFGPLESATEEEFHRHFNTNVLGLILTTQEAVKQFGAEGGSVINVSSVASTATPPGSVIYSATKAAVDAVTGVLAKELGPRRIRVNSINPGPIVTEGFQAQGFSGSDFEKQAVAQTPLGRIGQPEDIGPVAVFLASSDSRWITGETIRVAGGLR
jgi:3-oxoacyl-[acyl-carrier protein] reductase